MDDKKNEIVKKVSALYNKYGIKSITMDDVAHELGISKKTLYEHFSDKTCLVKTVIDYISHEREELFCQQNQEATNALEELLRIYRFYLKMTQDFNPSFEFDLKKYYPEIFSSLKRLKREKIMESTVQNLKKGKKEGLYRPEIKEDILSRLNLLRIESLSETDLFTQDEIFSKNVVEEMFFYHLYGILSADGVDYLNKHLEILHKEEEEIL